MRLTRAMVVLRCDVKHVVVELLHSPAISLSVRCLFAFMSKRLLTSSHSALVFALLPLRPLFADMLNGV